MKTFEDEYKELAMWYFSEHDKIEGLGIPWSGGLDGEHTNAIRKLLVEYRKKLKQLRQKHGK